ncbi:MULTISPECIES: DUF4190 domain-containing protein [Arthrobacter]|uniref:DUF4190 domain-containing protein n=1 Tax=Arthrobacter TaxID=1663 RepID=UPI003396C39C
MSENPENPYGQPVKTQAPYSQPGQAPAPYGQQPPAPYGQQPAPYGAPAVDPGKTLSIVAIILPFVGFGLVGMILGFVALSKSKKAGFGRNTLALVAVIIGGLAVVASIIATIVIVVAAMNAVNEVGGLDLITQVVNQCQSTGAESVVVDGLEYSCAGY